MARASTARKQTPANDTPPPANDAGKGTGHNSGDFSPAEHKALKLDHYRRIAAQKSKVDVEKAEYDRLRKLAKADKIILSDIDFMLKCANVDDPTIIPARIRREAEIASWFALPVEFQPDMFGDFTREPTEDLATRQGRAAGASGVGLNPYDENSPSGRAWATAWSAEQAAHREALASAMEKKNAAADLIKGAGNDGDLDDQDGDA